MNICVIGAGYVGLITALCFGKKENKVICVEKNLDKLNMLKTGVPTIFEEGLDELLKESLNTDSVKFTDNLEMGIKSSDIIFIAVGTPTKDNWDVDIGQVEAVINLISPYINKYKVVVTKSTVPVGTQKYITSKLLENHVPKEYFDVISNPEFLREGKAIYDFFHGDKIVLGSESQKALEVMRKLYEPFKIKMVLTNPETAELIKYTSNALLSVKISFINEIANLCNKACADIDVIAYALGLDKRISPLFLKAGIGYGGSCFPKDTKALVKMSENYNCDLNIVKATVDVNEKQRVLPVDILLEHYKIIEGKTVAILGLTFKPDTDDIREAPSLYIIEKLLMNKVNIKAYDPMVTNEIKNIFPDITYCDGMYECLEDCDAMIICTEWNEFYSIDLCKANEIMRESIIIDGRNILDIEKIKEANIKAYYSVGKGNIKN
ncbi:UDP-glucose dehydrogenase family protein [Clostridium estertheticum]|uniref:UDP-glucose dehydrogenase family protein n=1 Tax=Clostridium estertheticum TaxID=238834 RepID=UPI001CF1A3EE|nr:UDP-glucose/GDP-mannose dehydrogenase family protein [Clostridium estertheticum]MCB2353969.1 UDP-glucose/GDP-mannose dehydrogenase family protein [Clostridium estertheticum]WAG43108.1 UDP-glucose/GDP-mannose dehydrogenase family protein [Clostridium estertheticum]